MKQALLRYLEKAVNAYLQQDGQSAARLDKLDGKSICIELLPWQLAFYCYFIDGRMTISQEAHTTPAVTLTGTPMQLGAVMLAKESRKQFFADDLQIDGDAEIAQQVTDLFDHVSIDWEDQASRFIGDIPAHQLANAAQQVRKWLKQSSAELKADVSDYLHEEAAWFPTRDELSEFFNDIDTLRMDSDRLEARLNQLRSNMEQEDSK